MKCDKKPLVSIGLAVYNEEKFIEKTIDSLLKQDFEDFEIIISDNVSTDRTFEICLKYMNKDKRIRLHRNKRNLGTATLKSILKLADGKYFMLAGGHDLWEPSFISKCIDKLDSDPNIVLCHTKCAEIDREGNFIRIMPDSLDTRNLSLEEKLPKVWSLKTGVPIYGLMRLDAFNSTNPFRGVLGTDIIVLSELSALGSIAYIDELLFYQRNHRQPESSEQSIRRTLKSMNPDQHKIKYETAWLDLLAGHMEVLSRQDISKEKENFLLNKLMECFKLNYGELPKTEVKKLSDYYIEYFENNRNGQSNLRFIREAQVALRYINLGLLLYPKLNSLIKAYKICNSIITATFVKRLKIAGEDESQKDLTQIDQASAFATEIEKVISEYKPTKIIETGTYLGTGTTSLIAKALKKYGVNDAKFFTIEVNPEHFVTAQKNIKDQNIEEYVTGLYGLSVPRGLLPDINQIEEYCVSNIEFDDIYVDHQENERARLYYNETNFNDGEDDLLGKCLSFFYNSPDFVLLDSGGHMGNIEFNYLINKLKKSCIVALDDIYHIKHRKSFEQIKTDSRFKLLAHSEEKFGFCIAHFNPVNALEIDKDIAKILWVRIDSIGDNILASSMLENLKSYFKNAEIDVLCQNHIAELYTNCPFVNQVLSIDKKEACKNEDYRNSVISKLKQKQYGLALNSIFSSEPIADFFTLYSGAEQKIKIKGNIENSSSEWLNKTKELYTHEVEINRDVICEIDRHNEFLKSLNIFSKQITPTIWLSEKEELFAKRIFEDNNLDPAKTIVLFAGTQFKNREYSNYGKALNVFCKKNDYSIISIGTQNDFELNRQNLDNIEVRTVNLSGKTGILEAAAIIKNCKLAIGAETGNAHIACAVNTPNVIVIGGGHFGRFMPYSELTSLVTLPLNCYGCNWKCKFERAYCVKDVDYKLILTAVENAINSKSKKPKIYFNQLPNEKSKNIVEKMFSKFLDADKVELIELKRKDVQTYSQKLLLLAEEAIHTNCPKNAKELLENILIVDPLNINALNYLAVLEILDKNNAAASGFLQKVVSVDPENKIAKKNISYIKKTQKRNKESAQDLSPLKISVITPSFNQGKFIERTIQSVLNQNYPDFEHIIIDGGSTDGTIEILKKYSHLIWVSEKDKGQSDALNKGFGKATGDIIAWINSDDWYEQNTFSAVSKFFKKYQYKNIVMGNCNLVDENGKVFDRVINYERGFEELKNFRAPRSIPTQPAVFFRKKLLEEYGLLDLNLEYTMDYDLWMRFAKKDRFFHINRTIANYRFHKDAKIGDMNWEKIYPECEIVKQRYYTDDKNPLVSVVIPCYNYAEYLPDAVNSVINQTYKNWEIIIVNDGSEDNTAEVASQLISSNPDRKIKLINQDNSGKPAVSRNRGIAESNGEYILPLDADDMLIPGALKMYIDELENINTDNCVVYAWLKTFGVTSNLWQTREFQLNELLHKTMLPYCSMFHRSVWQKLNGYRTNVGYEDWDFWIGAAENGAAFLNIPRVTTLRRETENTSRQETDRKQHELNIAGIIKNHKFSFENEELEWSDNYLINYLISSSIRAHQSSKEKYPGAAAILIYHYPELYEKDEVEWANNYLAENPFVIRKGIKIRKTIKSSGVTNQELVKKLVNQGVANLNNNLNNEALKNFDEALKFAPQLPEIKYGKAVAFANTGEIEKAKNELDELLKIKPDYTFARQLLINIS